VGGGRCGVGNQQPGSQMLPLKIGRRSDLYRFYCRRWRVPRFGGEVSSSVRQRTFYPPYHAYVSILLVAEEWVFLEDKC
jgi:hypothetical protein